MHNNAKAPFVQFRPHYSIKLRNNKNGTALKWRAGGRQTKPPSITEPSNHDALLHQEVNQQQRRGG